MRQYNSLINQYMARVVIAQGTSTRYNFHISQSIATSHLALHWWGVYSKTLLMCHDEKTIVSKARMPWHTRNKIAQSLAFTRIEHVSNAKVLPYQFMASLLILLESSKCSASNAPTSSNSPDHFFLKDVWQFLDCLGPTVKLSSMGMTGE